MNRSILQFGLITRLNGSVINNNSILRVKVGPTLIHSTTAYVRWNSSQRDTSERPIKSGSHGGSVSTSNSPPGSIYHTTTNNGTTAGTPTNTNTGTDKTTVVDDSSTAKPRATRTNASSDFTDESVKLKSIKNLPSEEDAKRSDLAKWVGSKMDSLQATMFAAGRTLNDVTGYSSIEALKQSIEDQQEILRQCRIQVRTAKDEYAAAVNQRSNSQREVNELLQRKHQWSNDDLQRFTDLYRSDHENETRVAQAARAADEAERVVEDSQLELTRLIAARYREEQVWSDKIRRASTWGTWGLMGFNVVLFLLVQLGLEPWKRRRLVGSFEEKVQSALVKTTALQEERLKNLEDMLFSTDQPGTHPIVEAADSDILSDIQQNPEHQHNTPLLKENGSLTWSNLYTRVQTGFEQSQVIPVNSVELVSTAGVGAVIGILGTLAVLAFK
ncbi:She9p [Sugiyamaella lignohabitans]|uniref:Sensitive to high expression protein 9, mitochondrial n=1 Tax=Sugiyamaella lignohabitans TaxID=796027 RepID=A0A161HLF9_9ASCO|nr:She9p [Sugiyamaella lignohabitans]ANB12898.1 She9p [Sugiyamaella lignohabitans]